MPKQSMKAAVVREYGKPLDICEVAKPQAGAGTMLIKVEACGVCHTDLHTADGDWPVKPPLPLIPGHEGVGFVAEVGTGVKHIMEGDRVGVPWLHMACGRCEHCFTGWETLCDHQQMTGYTVDGSYAEFVVADPNYVALLPRGLDFAPASPVLCAGVTVYKGLKVLDCKPGDWVVVSGIGGLGHMAMQYAKAMGFHVAAVDIAEDKLALARQLGAEITLNAKDADPAVELRKQIEGAHGVLVTAMSRPAFAQAVNMLRKRGTMSLVGLPPGNFDLPIFDVVLNAKTARGSIVGTRKDLEESLQFAAEGKVKSHFSTDRLDNINAVFQRMKDGKIDGRVVLTF